MILQLTIKEGKKDRMFKVLSNLKESIFAVIAIILLLILQANCDLALPDYTSRIVNVGIQQSGIENTAPETIRKSTMDSILMFTYDDEYILSNYILNGDLYNQKKLNNEEQENLNNIKEGKA